jgi:G3E family GTPase
MPGPTDVVLITGFLGSGKTTLLNHLIERYPADHRLMVLMNEFGEIGIDGHLIEGEDLELLEIHNGSVFCVCVKTDFIRGMVKIAREIRPDTLVIEATGVADPSDMKRDLALPVFNESFRLKEQICVIDAQHFVGAYAAFASVEKQIESATLFVINKVDLASPEMVSAIKAIVGRHHSQPIFLETRFARLPEKHSAGLFGFSDNNTARGRVLNGSASVEETIAELMGNPGDGMQPADDLHSVVYHWQGTDSGTLRQLGRALPEGILRAKGFVRLAHRWHLFSHVMTQTEILPVDIRDIPKAAAEKIVFIGDAAAIADLERMQRHYPIEIICQSASSSVVQILPELYRGKNR